MLDEWKLQLLLDRWCTNSRVHLWCRNILLLRLVIMFWLLLLLLLLDVLVCEISELLVCFVNFNDVRNRFAGISDVFPEHNGNIGGNRLHNVLFICVTVSTVNSPMVHFAMAAGSWRWLWKTFKDERLEKMSLFNWRMVDRLSS